MSIDATVWNPSLVRQALDELLRRYPMFDLVSIDWQWADDFTEHGVWVLVKLGQPSANFAESPAWAIWPFAIFKATGALHGYEGEGDQYPGAIADPPLWTPRAGLECEVHPGREAVAKIGLPGPGSRWACRECFKAFEQGER